MVLKIEKKIVGYKVVSEEEEKKIAQQASNDENIKTVEEMHENVSRPDLLFGSTYKIKTPQSEHALYITINDMILNDGTKHEERRPYEVFINSKNMDHFQWVVALTRVISAVFRKGGDVTFMVEELKAVFDPKGGYFKKGGVFMPSLVAEIGCAIEAHLKHIGMLKAPELDEHQQKLVDDKRKEYESRQKKTPTEQEANDFPATAQLCSKCNTKALVLMDGCMTCLSCGDSKCG
ncbi:MAG: NrdJb [Gammaproteobacteria bacterium]|nr:NrdJb [Gammaproteobacteria bacterium]